jgi:hypothetical protein
MKTEVIMKRELFGQQISQSSKSEFFSATDLVKAGNIWRIQNNMPMFNMATWFQNDGVKDFVRSLEERFGSVKINSKGKNSHTWVHPYLFIDMALAISPELKIEVYSWIYDHLLKYRNDSGDSYKKMCGALYNRIPNKVNFPKHIMDIANRIRSECNVSDWQEATEDQLKLRDKIHEYVALLSDILREADNLIDVAVRKAKTEIDGKTK